MGAFLSGDGFTNAQRTCSTYRSLLIWPLILLTICNTNIIETLTNIAYLYLVHIVQWPAAPMIGFGSALVMLSKIISYSAVECYCGHCEVGLNY
jgi:hypothetical protein